MTKEKKYLIGGIVALILIVGTLYLLQKSTSTVGPSNLDGFTQCIANSGAKFYGAFWCPHCRDQKELFGSSVKLLPYIECSNPDGLSQNDLCTKIGIQSYPTWIFKDGSQLSGTIPLANLAQKTNCTLPGTASTSTSPLGSTSPIFTGTSTAK